MTTHADKLNDKLDSVAAGAKDAIAKVVDTAHAAVEVVRDATASAGEKLSAAGEKVTEIAK